MRTGQDMPIPDHEPHPGRHRRTGAQHPDNETLPHGMQHWPPSVLRFNRFPGHQNCEIHFGKALSSLRHRFGVGISVSRKVKS
jgi:hypothetical protein